MGLQDPVAVYNAANHLEAQVVCDLLNQAGIEAYLTEDVSQVGVWWGGLVSEIHKQQVWVDRSNVDQTVPFLDAYEQRRRELAETGLGGQGSEVALVEAVCEECGGAATFPAAQRGSVQECPHCGAFIDVGEEELFEEPEGGEPAESGAE
jgi:hypothetical protein